MKKLLFSLVILLPLLVFGQSGKKTSTTKGVHSDTTIYRTSDTKPDFPGGEVALQKYVQDSMVYPPIAFKNKIEGIIFVNCVVEKDGKLTGCDVNKTIPYFDSEALRIVKAMPNWKPGIKDGSAVRVGVSVPVRFKVPANKGEVGEIEAPEELAFQVVEQMPQFPGDNNGLFKFIAKSTTYPAEAMQNDIEGTVFIQFIVEKQGDVSHITVSRGVDEYLDAEAVRIIRSMPKWKPGKQNGKEVRVYYTVPIKFKLK